MSFKNKIEHKHVLMVYQRTWKYVNCSSKRLMKIFQKKDNTCLFISIVKRIMKKLLGKM